jgi:L-fuculose-phosphate aldolase
MGDWEDERQELWQVAQEMWRTGLVSGASGNASMRLPTKEGRELIAITPSRLPYHHMKPQDIVVIDFEGEPIEGESIPSSETLMHIAIYRKRPDVNGVVHTHSIFASVAAVAGLEIPPLIDEMVMVIGGAVRVSEYAFPGTEELAERACAALGERQAALLRNHGLVAVGRSPHEALEVCQLVERVAQIFTYASLAGKAIPLPYEATRAEEAIFRMQREVHNSEEGEQ